MIGHCWGPRHSFSPGHFCCCCCWLHGPRADLEVAEPRRCLGCFAIYEPLLLCDGEIRPTISLFRGEIPSKYFAKILPFLGMALRWRKLFLLANFFRKSRKTYEMPWICCDWENSPLFAAKIFSKIFRGEIFVQNISTFPFLGKRWSILMPLSGVDSMKAKFFYSVAMLRSHLLCDNQQKK